MSAATTSQGQPRESSGCQAQANAVAEAQTATALALLVRRRSVVIAALTTNARASPAAGSPTVVAAHASPAARSNHPGSTARRLSRKAPAATRARPATRSRTIGQRRGRGHPHLGGHDRGPYDRACEDRLRSRSAHPAHPVTQPSRSSRADARNSSWSSTTSTVRATDHAGTDLRFLGCVLARSSWPRDPVPPRISRRPALPTVGGRTYGFRLTVRWPAKGSRSWTLTQQATRHRRQVRGARTVGPAVLALAALGPRSRRVERSRPPGTPGRPAHQGSVTRTIRWTATAAMTRCTTTSTVRSARSRGGSRGRPHRRPRDPAPVPVQPRPERARRSVGDGQRPAGHLEAAGSTSSSSHPSSDLPKGTVFRTVVTYDGRPGLVDHPGRLRQRLVRHRRRRDGRR